MHGRLNFMIAIFELKKDIEEYIILSLLRGDEGEYYSYLKD